MWYQCTRGISVHVVSEHSAGSCAAEADPSAIRAGELLFTKLL